MVGEGKVTNRTSSINSFNYFTRIGKSSIANGIRRVLDGSEGAASVNECEETMKPTPYPHPQRGDLILWDLPGGGTPNHPIESYFDDKSLLAFDCIVLVCE